MLTHLIVNNVCDALPMGVDQLLTCGHQSPSRAGDVIAMDSPVVTEYMQPWRRVLFNKVRNANPFFNLAEAMWMLAGRHDAEYINQFVHDFGLRFAEDGIIWGSYGHRWRKHFYEIDQLSLIIDRLKKDPNDRRIVLAMWDVSYDIMDRKDIPCNTHVYFRIRDSKLDMTVCCRSNDIIWGAYGANAVHFSFLQEYMALAIGVEMGTYYHLSNNYHAYIDEIDRMKGRTSQVDLYYALQDNRYNTRPMMLCPLHDGDARVFDRELELVLENPMQRHLSNEFLRDTFVPVLLAHKEYKAKGKPETWLTQIQADDWRIACTEWIDRRLAKTTSPTTHAEADKSVAITPGQD